jgi:colanic acid biosynthesis glycosyl transferase WcaI
MRVLMTSQYFWPEIFPINDLARGLAERDHAVTVLTGLPNFPIGTIFPGYGLRGPWQETHEGVEIKRVPLIPRGNGGHFRIALNHLSYGVAGSGLGPFRVRARYDVVMASQPSPLLSVLPGLLLSRLKRLPLVLWVQDLWPDSLAIAGVHNRMIWNAMEHTMRFIYRRSDLVLLQSRAFSDHALSRGVGAERIRYFPNWAEPVFSSLSREDASAEDRELPPGFRVLFGGNLGEAQALDSVIKAADLLREQPEIKFVLIGEGRRRPWLEAEIAKRGLQRTVSCLGHRPLERMPFYFAAADVLLMTLKRNAAMARTIPSKLQAYLASGRPIIAALDGESQRIVVSAGAGLGCAAEDHVALAETVARLASASMQTRSAMGDAALACSRREFERARLLDQLEGWLTDLVAGRPVRGPAVQDWE